MPRSARCLKRLLLIITLEQYNNTNITLPNQGYSDQLQWLSLTCLTNRWPVCSSGWRCQKCTSFSTKTGTERETVTMRTCERFLHFRDCWWFALIVFCIASIMTWLTMILTNQEKAVSVLLRSQFTVFIQSWTQHLRTHTCSWPAAGRTAVNSLPAAQKAAGRCRKEPEAGNLGSYWNCAAWSRSTKKHTM